MTEDIMETLERYGGPAAPCSIEIGGTQLSFTGLTIRDHFAAQAMRGFNSEMVRYEWGESVVEKAAEMAYKIADAMLKERAK